MVHPQELNQSEEKELAVTISFSIDAFDKVMEATKAMYPDLAKTIASELKTHILEKHPELEEKLTGSELTIKE